MKKILFLIALLFASEVSAQDDYETYYKDLKEVYKKESWWYRTWNRFEVNPGCSKYAIGPAMVKPLNGWNNYNQTFALRYRSEHLEASAAWWEGQKGENLMSKNASRFSLGYFTPITKGRIGNRYMDVKGLLVQPVAGIGLSRNDGNYGVYASPGLHLQLPFLVIGARLNAEYAFGDGLNFIPELSIQFDALRDLLDPTTVKTGTNTTTMTTATPLGGGWYKVSSKTSTSNIYLKDVGPFWGITPRFGFFPLYWTDQGDETINSYGIGISGRINFLGADIRYDRSQLIPGVVTNVNDLHPTMKSKFDNENLKGTISSTELSFSATINVVGAVLNIIRPSNYGKMGFETTPLNRFNLNLGFTRFMPGKVKYDDPGMAIAYTDSFFAANPEIPRNAINDPLLHEKGWGVSYGFTYEMGAVGFGVNNRLSKTYGKSTMLEMYYILPLNKIRKAYR